jgi:hypothetical protein
MDDQRIAIPPPGQQAILNAGRRPKLLNQKQATNQQHQNDNNSAQARSLAFGRLLILRVLLPMVMAVQKTLHWSLLLV